MTHQILIRSLFLFPHLRAVETAKAEWPLSHNAQFETPAADDAPFDYMKEADKFYFEAEGTGAVDVGEVMDKVPSSFPSAPHFEPLHLTRLIPCLSFLPG
jgi:hypothetical protein